VDKIEAILGVACELFAEKGFEHTPVSEIADRAGVAGGTIIYHFKTKDNLLHILTWQTLNALYKHSRQAVSESADGLGQVMQFIDSFFAFLVSHKNECLLLLKNRPFEKMKGFTSGPDMDTFTLHRMYTDFLQTVIKKGVDDRSIVPVPVRETAMALFAGLIGAAWLHLFFNEDREALRQAIIASTRCRLTTTS
jgi:AcrR family transcriptional regulator